MDVFVKGLAQYGLPGLVILAMGLAFMAYWRSSEAKLAAKDKVIEELHALRVADQSQRVTDANGVHDRLLKVNEGLLTAVANANRSTDANTVALTELRTAEKDELEQIAEIRDRVFALSPPRRS